MRVVLLNLAQPPEAKDHRALLDALFILVDWAEALEAAGASVTVVQGFHQDQHFTHRGVRYHLVAGAFTPYLHPWRIEARSLDAVAAASPDVVHVNSLLYARQAHALRQRLPAVGLVVQHHAEAPHPRRLGRWLQRRWLATADAFVFTGTEAARPWQQMGVLPADVPIHAISEGSSRFEPAVDRARARRQAGLTGEPQLLWLGNLDANKDPLTVLDGLAPVFAAHPHARALFCFRHGPLLPQVEARIAASAALRDHVELRGAVPYDQIEPMVQAADILIQGSHREGSGFAVLDALACGVVPVVTALPTFRFLTQDGAIGALWQPDDAAGCSAALEAVLAHPLAPQQKAARAWFTRALAYPVLARQMVEVYEQVRRKPAMV